MRLRLSQWIGLAVFLLGSAAVAAWVLTEPRPAFTDSSPGLERSGDAERGRLVFAAGDCASCHASPNQPDRMRLGGGLALASPYGTIRVPNISSHPVDGIGRWRTVDLANALLSGTSPSGRHYYPMFPYASYSHMTVDDVIDLRAYLRALPAVSGRPPAHELTFPFNVRRFIGLWKLMYFNRSAIEVDPRRSEAWNRGHYLVDGPAHCAECHSARNLLGAIKEQNRFAGGRDPQGTGFIPNITPGGIGDWSAADIARLLENGRTPDLRTVGSSMADVVTDAKQLPASDRLAIATYLKSLPARPTANP